MTPVDFFHDMAPHLGANLLTVMMVYYVVSYSKREDAGQEGSGWHLGGILMVGAFLAGGMMTWGFF